MLAGRLLFRGAVTALILLATACVNPSIQPQSPQQWSAHRDSVAALQQWQVSGKIALRSDVASESANLRWQQNEQHARLLLSGPLGVGATTIDSDGSKLEIQQGGEYRIMDISTPTAVVLNTGWDLPLRALPYWLKGIPSPDYPIQAQAFEEQSAQLRSLHQDGWTIEYESYQQFAALTLPTRIVIQRDVTRVKLLLRDWQDLAQQ
ncbi:MAG: outer membrane lipoprotein LolB [Halioglobus sp.]|jgi:outer membrane lipoprotein LolB